MLAALAWWLLQQNILWLIAIEFVFVVSLAIGVAIVTRLSCDARDRASERADAARGRVHHAVPGGRPPGRRHHDPRLQPDGRRPSRRARPPAGAAVLPRAAAGRVAGRRHRARPRRQGLRRQPRRGTIAPGAGGGDRGPAACRPSLAARPGARQDDAGGVMRRDVVQWRARARPVRDVRGARAPAPVLSRGGADRGASADREVRLREAHPHDVARGEQHRRRHAVAAAIVAGVWRGPAGACGAPNCRRRSASRGTASSASTPSCAGSPTWCGCRSP